jgi:hypothetical protein
VGEPGGSGGRVVSWREEERTRRREEKRETKEERKEEERRLRGRRVTKTAAPAMPCSLAFPFSLFSLLPLHFS